jgi:transcription elongation factor Elf1
MNVGGELVSEQMSCPGCGAKFGSYEKLIDHVVEKHNSNCQICGAELNTKEELLKHNKEKHGM